MATYNFPPTSRYYGIATAAFTTADGTQLVYLERRFLPPADSFSLLQLHVVSEGERLDNIAAQYMDDPTTFWRIADANSAMRQNVVGSSMYWAAVLSSHVLAHRGRQLRHASGTVDREGR